MEKRKYTRLDRDAGVDICRLYSAGLTLRDVGQKTGLSHEAVRLFLHERNIPLRPSGRPRFPPLSEIAVEVFTDLEDQFGGSATTKAMADWLGSSEQVADALAELFRRGWVGTTDGRHWSVNPAPPPEDTRVAERNAEIGRLARAGVKYREIAEEVGCSYATAAQVGRKARDMAE